MNHSRRLKMGITLLTLLAMLLLLLPAAVLADEEDEGSGLPSQASPRAHQVHANRPVDELETEEEEEELEGEEEEMDEPGERALFVAERNRLAWEWGLPPGFVNLFDKLSALTNGVQTREDIYARFTDSESPMRIKDLVREIKDARQMLELKTESIPLEQ